MLRPNLAMDAPPASIEVGGYSYRINVDFRVWLLIRNMSRDLYQQPTTATDVAHNLEVLSDMQVLAFDGILTEENPYTVLDALTAFLKGYPEPPENGSPEPKAPSMSFNYDLNYLILAIRNQGGPDLSYRRSEPFHWWEFLLEVQALCGSHYITDLMKIRSYEDTSKQDSKQANREALKLRARYALPYEMTADERRAAEEFDRLTGG